MSDGSVEALERAIADACWKAEAGETVAADLKGWLEGHGVAAEDVTAILQAPPRLNVYRSLVRNGLSSVVSKILPRTRARMNEVGPGRFDRDLAAFVDAAGPRTHHLRDVPAEFFVWAERRWRTDTEVLPYLPDLAAFELAHFAVGASASASAPVATTELALDRPLAFLDSTRLLDLAWAVHELPADPASADPPPRRPVRLLAYRDAEHTVRWLELTPLAAALLRRLLDGQALGASVDEACAAQGTTPAAVLSDVARLLADLGERGVLLGAR
jgi:uncharacterized protein